ncbi:type I-E CRISPR-associated protein Cas7/Cse4/CasC [Brachybacterium sp. p3-SID957]|uniref:type I-E CRISPR-associated protein Cas7/Cse4/CasC n=1 Tax=Brachybacterium sp. p3-SID957 TaxID=2916049 RepID=UPI00223BDAE1|nr:type I-E CRISPR-associated protein Cas7/Cse4/CasC [Brachybacterium sp. p3-SID957]MCT1775638.1 type I-E CRISPR-associated protein Cas7/Cse4/CasC [Brachybacterium sp. p3-SID957]
MSLTIDIHALQTLPPSNVNRDDTGAPKSAIYGGVPRQRVSSQSWKRAMRQAFERELGQEEVGYRTKRVAGLVTERVRSLTKAAGQEWEEEKAAAAARSLFTTAGFSLSVPKSKDGEAERAAETGYLMFLSDRQIQAAAQHVIDSDGQKLERKKVKELLDTSHSIDIAMFGRMVADDASYNVDASVQVAHAIGIHASAPEFDYFTAVDDVVEDAEETGAGMIGTVQMMSSTLYRYATIDVESLVANLGDEQAAHAAISAFLRAFITSIPSGKQNTFAANTLPELVYVTVRDGRSVSLVNAFEVAITSEDGSGRRREGAEKLAAEERNIRDAYGLTPLAAFVLGLGDLTAPFDGLAERVSLPDLVEKVSGAVTSAGDRR